MDRDLSGLCLKDKSFDTKNISYIIFFEILIGILANVISSDICLNVTLKICLLYTSPSPRDTR